MKGNCDRILTFYVEGAQLWSLGKIKCIFLHILAYHRLNGMEIWNCYMKYMALMRIVFIKFNCYAQKGWGYHVLSLIFIRNILLLWGLYLLYPTCYSKKCSGYWYNVSKFYSAFNWPTNFRNMWKCWYEDDRSFSVYLVCSCGCIKYFLSLSTYHLH